LHRNRVLHFNNLLDAVVVAVFLLLIAAVVFMSVREWVLLLARRRDAVLRETEPTWLPDYALAEPKSMKAAGAVALAVALARELSGEAHLERVQAVIQTCECEHPNPLRDGTSPKEHRKESYIKMTEQRFNSIRRCC